MAVELKDFIKCVISDIIGAVSDLQNEIVDSAVISPGITNQMAREYIFNGRDYTPIKDVDFEISVYGEAAKENNKGLGITIKALVVGATQKGCENEGSLSKIKFSIPIVLPVAHAKGCPTVTEKNASGNLGMAFSH